MSDQATRTNDPLEPTESQTLCHERSAEEPVEGDVVEHGVEGGCATTKEAGRTYSKKKRAGRK